MMLAHHVICAAFHIVIWNAPTEKFLYKNFALIYIFAKNEYQLLPELTE